MNFQILSDGNGNNSGVYIPAQQWDIIKQQYPDIEQMSNEIPNWQKEILTSRLETIIKNPERVKPIHGLYERLNKKVKP